MRYFFIDWTSAPTDIMESPWQVWLGGFLVVLGAAMYVRSTRRIA